MPDEVEFARRLRIMVYEGDPFWGNANEIVRLMCQCHANAIRYTGGIRQGLSCYPSQYFPAHPQLGGKDLLGEMVHACENYGFHVFPHIQFLYAFRPEAIALHPDWAAVNPDGSPIKTSYGVGSGLNDGTAVCFNNPTVIQTYARACQEITERYPVSGMYFDIAWRGNCFCSHCRELFFEQYGYELPDNPFINRQHMHDYLHGLHIRGIEKGLKTVTEAIKSVRPIPVIFNMVEANKRYSRHALMNFTDGALVAEMNNGNYMDLLQRVKTGAAFGKATWCYCPITNRSLFRTEDDLDTQLSALTEISHGGTPIIETVRAYLNDQTGVPQLEKIFVLMEKREKLFFDYRPIPWIALHCSAQTALEYGVYDTRSSGAEKGIWDNLYFSGAFSTLIQGHHPFSIILDDDISRGMLNNYKVVVLPNVACLSEDQISVLMEFVRNGGGLLATFETSLYDQGGMRRSDFGLRDLFQIHHSEKANVEYQSSLLMEGPYLRICRDHPITRGLEPDAKLPYYRCGHPFVPVEAAEEDAIVADIFYADGGEYGKPYAYPAGRPPAIVAGTFGRGKYIYMSAALDYLFAKTGLQQVQRIFDNGIEFLTDHEFLVRTNAPDSVVIHFTENKSSRLLHIFNYSGNTLHMERSQLGNIVPLDNLSFSITRMKGKKLGKISPLMGDGSILHECRNGCDDLRLSKLNEYECLLLEYV